MSNSVKAAVCLLVLLLAGCASSSHRSSTGVPDWESEDFIAAAVPAPAPASPTPTAAVPVVSTSLAAETWIPLARWCKTNGLPGPSRLSWAQLPAYALNTPGGVFVLRIGSQLARWDGLEVWLGFSPQFIEGKPFVHALDLEKTIQPLVCGAVRNVFPGSPTIVIDPGHGGDDSGTSSVLGSHAEKEFTLDWARRLAPLLATNGWRVLLTRNTDITLGPSNRVAFAEEQKADLFLSLHFNSSAPDHEQAGLETYCLTPAGLPSSMTRGYADDLGQAFPNNAFDRQNLLLALRVHRALLQVNGNCDRGVRRARFPAVLRGAGRPAILVEGGYLSNLREARLIAEPGYRQKLAEAVASALLLNPPEIRSPRGKARNSAARSLSSELLQTASPH